MNEQDLTRGEFKKLRTGGMPLPPISKILGGQLGGRYIEITNSGGGAKPKIENYLGQPPYAPR